jgi:hypothetical protein
MDQGMSVSWYDQYSALTSVRVWLDEGTGRVVSLQDGKTVFERRFASVEELRDGYKEALQDSTGITAGGASC